LISWGSPPPPPRDTQTRMLAFLAATSLPVGNTSSALLPLFTIALFEQERSGLQWSGRCVRRQDTRPVLTWLLGWQMLKKAPGAAIWRFLLAAESMASLGNSHAGGVPAIMSAYTCHCRFAPSVTFHCRYNPRDQPTAQASPRQNSAVDMMVRGCCRGSRIPPYPLSAYIGVAYG